MSQDQHNELLRKIGEISEKIEVMDEKLNPIYDTYNAWLTLGRWGKIILYLAGAILGLVVAWKQIFK